MNTSYLDKTWWSNNNNLVSYWLAYSNRKKAMNKSTKQKHLFNEIIKGVHGKRAYIAFRADFHFWRKDLHVIFGGLTCVDMKSIVRSCHWFSWCALCFQEITYAKKLSLPWVSLGDLLLNKNKRNLKVCFLWHLPPVLLFIWLCLFLTIASLAHAIKALKLTHLGLFCHDTGLIPGWSTFFSC